MRCPRCRQPIVRSDRPPLLLWECRGCGGCAATLAVLRKAIRHDAIQRAWNRTVGSGRTALLPCPECSTRMSRVPTEGPEVDLCRVCQLMWFDAGELEAMPHRSAESIAAEQKAERWAQEQGNGGGVASRTRRSSPGWDVIPTAFSGTERAEAFASPAEPAPRPNVSRETFRLRLCPGPELCYLPCCLAWRCMWAGFSRSPIRRAA
jgi:Zn-finger nucleic acid-binding protein